MMKKQKQTPATSLRVARPAVKQANNKLCEAQPYRLFGFFKPFLGGGAYLSQKQGVQRKSAAEGGVAFTLIEILLVVSIIGILAGAGLPSLGKALRVYRFKTNANQVQAFLYLARNSAMSEVRAKENSAGIDTNFDGTSDDSDLLPFAYVFEISHGAESAPVTLRTYADFNLNSSAYTTGTDVLLDQKTFNASELQITYTGRYEFDDTEAISPVSNGKTYSFSYSTSDGSLTMTESSVLTAQDIDLITIQMANPDATRTNTINLFHLSGAPFISE